MHGKNIPVFFKSNSSYKITVLIDNLKKTYYLNTFSLCLTLCLYMDSHMSLFITNERDTDPYFGKLVEKTEY